jgi:glycosyltransferase involved in cell wall biosynthesis
MPVGSGRLRVVFLPSWYPQADRPTYGIFLRDQAIALAKRCHVVVVPVPRPTSLFWRPWLWRDRCRVRHGSASLVELHLSGPNYTPRARNANEGVIWRLYRRGLAEAVRLLGGPADLIHAHVAIEAGYFGARLAEMYDVPLVLTEHISRPTLLMSTPRDRERALYAMHAATTLICVSAPQRELLPRAGVERGIDVVANVVDTGLFTPAGPIAPPPLRLITVGHLIVRKGIVNLLAAVARLRMMGLGSLELDVVGTGPLRPRLEAMTVALGLAGRVRFHGERSHLEVRNLLRRSHIYVCPSVTESFGVAVVEAMSVGLPVVVTRSGGPESYVRDAHGMVVAPDSIEALMEGIRGIVGRLGDFDAQRQREYVLERFSPDVVGSEVEKRYALALERHARRTPGDARGVRPP